ncbi:phosphotransferase [Sphingomonas sp. CGMCC 1.13654]|uniref:Phosphotransferase n=1 Tax=Sphingomonas chungangi TaxID=2683589 RepID=A0A838L369_9SPHN|nr:phosphotransferase [Sphingomonas chungangi]
MKHEILGMGFQIVVHPALLAPLSFFIALYNRLSNMTPMANPLFPATADAITPLWMEQALSARFPGTRIATIKLTTFIDGTAQKMRYEIAYETRPDGAPASLWTKGGFDPKGASQGDAFANEVRFFRDISPDLSINLPDCYFGAIDPLSNNGVVLLEDLTARGASFGRATIPLTPEQAAAVLTAQAQCHAYFWQGYGKKPPRWLRPGGAIAATGMVDQYFGLWDGAAPRPRFAHLTAGQRDRDRMRRALNRLMDDLRTRPICLLHGDPQHGNLFFDPGGRPGYLDWQHCMLGVWAFDVAGFLVTALTVPDRRSHERDLLAHYLTALGAAGVGAPAFEDAWADYARYAMWGFMWAMCPVDAHPEEICSSNTERACTAMSDLDTVRLLAS